MAAKKQRELSKVLQQEAEDEMERKQEKEYRKQQIVAEFGEEALELSEFEREMLRQQHHQFDEQKAKEAKQREDDKAKGIVTLEYQ